jgi:hypothetical protein
MVAALPETTAITVTAQRPGAASRPQPSFFHRLLSELNPLQYVPVVGTIYRAITGDTIPQSARFAGSLVVSGLTGGPIGLAINLGTTALEKLTGIDPEAIGTRLLADIGIGNHQSAPATYAKADTTAPACSTAQLSAYGIVQGAGGTLTRGDLSAADVLNSLELSRLGHTDGKALFSAIA